MTVQKISIAFFLICVIGCGDRNDSGGSRATATARSAKQGLDAAGHYRLSPEDRCPVCAMAVASHPKSAAAIVLADGTTYYFCGNGCLIKSWLHPEVYLGVDKSKLSKSVVTDYFTGAPTDAMTATWVAGSDVVGPMGKAFVPLKSGADLAPFKARHGGKREFKLEEMNDTLFHAITGKQPIPMR